jgi:tetratricopeptide (TPR) repeat protein
VASARAAQACESADEELRTAAGNILKQLDESGPAVLLGGAIKQMTAEAFEEAERLLEAAAARFPKDASILFHLAICQQRLKRGTKAGETLARAEAFAREPQLVEAIRSMKEQLAHAGVLDDAVARLGRNDFAGAAAAFERVPAAVRERPDIKLLYCLARARVLADNPYAANRQSKLRAIAAELRDVKQRTDDAQVRSQAEALLAQLRNAGIY